uniref:Putative mediator of rna polymerase ii transcription subunit 13-like trichogramma pretiosum n=1 Tax=Xenopsylla cheopis TaxID=163159 RepID=A0A6M2DRX9_XENCH
MESGEYGEGSDADRSQLIRLSKCLGDAMRTCYDNEMEICEQNYASKDNYPKTKIIDDEVKKCKTKEHNGKFNKKVGDVLNKLDNAQYKTNINNNEEITIDKSINRKVYNESLINKSSEKDNNTKRTNQDNIYENLRYDEYDEGPFVINVESNSKNIGKIHQMSLGRLIFQKHAEFKQAITEIKAIGKNKIKIEVNDFKVANKLINDRVFMENNMRSYIPTYTLIKKGVIYDVDTDFSEAYIKDNIVSEIPILGIKRILKKVNNEYRKTTVCILIFRGQRIPEKVSIHAVKCRVATYNKITQCFNCLRYGHVTRQCRSGTRCSQCAENHNYKDCPNKKEHPKCALCEGNHLGLDKKCEAYIRQKKIKEIMEYNNIGFNEASRIVDNRPYANAFATKLELQSKETFPTLATGHHQSTLMNKESNTNIFPKKRKILNTTNNHRTNKIYGTMTNVQDKSINTFQIIRPTSSRVASSLKIESRNIRRNIDGDRKSSEVSSNIQETTYSLVNKEINKVEEERRRNIKKELKEIIKNIREKIFNKEKLDNEEIWLNIDQEIESICNRNVSKKPSVESAENIKKKKEENQNLQTEFEEINQPENYWS